jgi:hypothetical protein
MLLIEDRRNYIYVYLDPKVKGNFKYTIDNKVFIFDYEPFYIGRGKNNRIIEHLFESKREKRFGRKLSIKNIKILNSLEYSSTPFYFKILENLSIKESLDLEIKFIESIGRLDKNTGPLTNLCRGGVGDPDWKNIIKSKWKRSIQKYYSNSKNRKNAGYYSTIDYFISEYGIEEGTKKYNERIEKMKKSIHTTYQRDEIRNKCKNFGKKNGFLENDLQMQ